MPAPSQKPIIWKPTANGQFKKLSGPCEVGYLKLTTGSNAAAAAIFDAKENEDLNENNQVWLLDSGVSSNDSDGFNQPLEFKRGLTVRIDQGGDGNATICVAVGDYTS